MAKVKETPSSKTSKPMRPAITPEAREQQMIALAVDRAEQQLRDGTASSQVITHYLKLAATKEKDKLELEKMREENKLVAAKTKAMEAQTKSDEKYKKVLDALRKYSGHGGPDEDDDEY